MKKERKFHKIPESSLSKYLISNIATVWAGASGYHYLDAELRPAISLLRTRGLERRSVLNHAEIMTLQATDSTATSTSHTQWYEMLISPLGRSIYLRLLPFLPSTQVSVKIARVIESQIVGKGKHLTVEGQIQCRNVVAPGYSDLATRCPFILPRLIAAKCSTIAQLPGPQGHKEEKRWQASQLQKPCLQRAVSALRHRQGLKKTSELGTGTCSRNMWLCHGQPIRASALSKWQSQPVELRNKSALSEIRKQLKPVSQSLETDWLSSLSLPQPFQRQHQTHGRVIECSHSELETLLAMEMKHQNQAKTGAKSYECKCYMWKNHCNKIMSSCKGHISDLNVFIGHWMSGLTMESAGCELAVVDFDSSMNKGNSQLDLRMPSTCLSQWIQFNLQWCRSVKIVSRLIPGKNLSNPTVGTGLVPSKAHLRLLYPIQNIFRNGFLQCAGNRVQQVLTQFVKTRSQHLELPQVMKGDEFWSSST